MMLMRHHSKDFVSAVRTLWPCFDTLYGNSSRALSTHADLKEALADKIPSEQAR